MVKRDTYLQLKEAIEQAYPSRKHFTTYRAHVHLNAKTRDVRISDVFAKMLISIRGLSAERVSHIVRKYPTAAR